jgi:hypothetical protein
MSEDHDPLADTRRFQPIDPYNIGPDTAGAPLPDHDPEYGPEYDPEYDGGAAGWGAQGAAGAPGAPARGGLRRRLRGLGAPKLVALGAAGVIVVGGVAWGTTAALASSKSSSSSNQPTAKDPLPEDAGASSGGGGKRAKTGAKAARVTITKLDTGSFTGTDAKGQTVTVVYGDDTKFGTKARPLSVDQLQTGMVVTVAGTRSGDTITAVLVAVPAKKAEPTATPST